MIRLIFLPSSSVFVYPKRLAAAQFIFLMIPKESSSADTTIIG